MAMVLRVVLLQWVSDSSSGQNARMLRWLVSPPQVSTKLRLVCSVRSGPPGRLIWPKVPWPAIRPPTSSLQITPNATLLSTVFPALKQIPVEKPYGKPAFL
jgi:hypothetical protein